MTSIFRNIVKVSYIIICRIRNMTTYETEYKDICLKFADIYRIKVIFLSALMQPWIVAK